MASKFDSSDIFSNVSQKITQLLYGRAQDDYSLINKALDDLNSLNYRYPVVTNTTKAVLLINQCCSLVNPEDFDLVSKCCRLITNLVVKQKIPVEGRTLQIAVQWCLKALRGSKDDVDVLIALDALLRSSQHELMQEIVRNPTVQALSKDSGAPEIAVYALQILEAATFLPETDKSGKKLDYSDKFSNEFQICFDILLNYLLQDATFKDRLVGVKILTVCLRGLQNIVEKRPDMLHDNLGLILGVIRSYMLFDFKNIDFVRPTKLMPSSLSLPEPSSSIQEKKGGKMMRQRKHKTQQFHNKQKSDDNWTDNVVSYVPATNIYLQGESSNTSNRLKTSDSDFSDTDGGNASKLLVHTGRVRQAALNLFLNVAKLTEKQVMFSFWSSFIPENMLSGKHNLVTCVLHETSNRGKMAALNVLLFLLSSAKWYLAQAEKGENLSFTPFSVVIGLMLKELHKCLSLALNENSIPVLTQVLKCYASLVQATPYHKLNHGLITKVIRSVKRFIYHRDPTVQVSALIVLGCCLAKEPPILETKDAFMSDKTKHTNKTEIETKTQTIAESDLDYVEFSSSDNDDEQLATLITGELPWLIEKCLSNLGENSIVIPTSVKLESLQILSAMSRNYFETLLGFHLTSIVTALNLSLNDKYIDVRLHSCQAVDFIGQAIDRHLSNQNDGIITRDSCVAFWLILLDGNFKTLLSSDCHANVKTIACDALGSIGNIIFEHLPRDKQILCITLLFACSRDDDICVKGAAIRALAISVLYPSLREDSGFVMDTAEAIYRALEEGNSNVRVKLAWALGNLSDALVLNKTNPNLVDDLPDSLLLKLLNATNKASREGEKVRMNTVRALGNLLQIVSKSLVTEKIEFRKAVEEGVDVLVNNSTSGSNMKVRWNACYALGNVMKNPDLYDSPIGWQEKVFNSLSNLVVNFKNFKVRIHAAVALATPAKREFYGQFYQLTWVSMLKALETAQNMDDFNEYKHRDHLIEQICLTLGHLITLLTKEDLVVLNNIFPSDLVKVQMKRVWERLLPEKSTILYDAYNYINHNFNGEKDLNFEQKAALKCLNEILKQDF